ncbi:glycoside hydrolase family 15 protein [Nocardia sp. NPDC004151]|uniref:glycoside hydrolase family 15 protein n=1 Tax=Nocardia sp. NPDC004151 TaxID=3364304 RepID=UPI00367A1181
MFAAAHHDHLPAEYRSAVGLAVEAIATHRDRRDAWIWEIDDEHWAHSGLICAAGLRAVAGSPDTGADSAVCTALADALVSRVAKTSVHPTGRWQRSPQHPEVDAALLLPIIRGAVPLGDPRVRATVSAVARELSSDYYVYRYRDGENPLGDNEGAFLLCGFAMAIATADLSLPVTAARYFERNRAACGTPGLFAEEFDVTQRQLRGNLPQAFVHALLLEASNHPALQREWANLGPGDGSGPAESVGELRFRHSRAALDVSLLGLVVQLVLGQALGSAPTRTLATTLLRGLTLQGCPAGGLGLARAGPVLVDRARTDLPRPGRALAAVLGGVADVLVLTFLFLRPFLGHGTAPMLCLRSLSGYAEGISTRRGG